MLNPCKKLYCKQKADNRELHPKVFLIKKQKCKMERVANEMKGVSLYQSIWQRWHTPVIQRRTCAMERSVHIVEWDLTTWKSHDVGSLSTQPVEKMSNDRE